MATTSPITLRDVDLASREATAALDESFFRVRFDRLTPAEKRYLRAMAELGPGPHRSGDIATLLDRKVTALGPTRNQLIAKGMVWSPSHGDTAFHRAAVRRVHAPDDAGVATATQEAYGRRSSGTLSMDSTAPTVLLLVVMGAALVVELVVWIVQERRRAGVLAQLEAMRSGAAVPDAVLDLGAVATALKDPAVQLEFTFPDLDDRPVSLSDPQFRGKVVIVTLAGSWCPNCHDEAAFLAQLHRELGGQGLEVVSLMFEHFGDFAQAAAATRRFREKFGIEYTTLIAGTSDRDEAAKALPQLTGVFAFPTTIWVDRNGTVRKIHAGFSGPATGSHYADLTREFTEFTQQLLAEPVGAAAGSPATDAVAAEAEAAAAP